MSPSTERMSGTLRSMKSRSGCAQPTEAAFSLEPLIKAERLIIRANGRDVTMMERKGAVVMLRNEDGRRESHKHAVLPSETALAAFRDGTRYPELDAVRRELLDWRLYHDFRTDAGSPVRQPCPGHNDPDAFLRRTRPCCRSGDTVCHQGGRDRSCRSRR